jgi:hypothetical protein
MQAIIHQTTSKHPEFSYMFASIFHQSPLILTLVNSGQSLGTFLLTLHMNPFNEI